MELEKFGGTEFLRRGGKYLFGVNISIGLKYQKIFPIEFSSSDCLDARVSNWALMDSPVILFGILSFYLLTIYRLGPA